MELVTSMGVMLDDDLRPINKAMYAAALVPGGELLRSLHVVFVPFRPHAAAETTNANHF
jgi:hypothetical protein